MSHSKIGANRPQGTPGIYGRRNNPDEELLRLYGRENFYTAQVKTTKTITPSNASSISVRPGELLRLDPSTGAFAFTLPKAKSRPNSRLFFANVTSSTNAVTLTAATGETINGAATFVVDQAYSAAILVSDGDDWFIDSTQLLAGSVGTDELADNSVTNLKMADNAVDTAEIADGAVTNPKLGADAVDGTKLTDNAVGSEHIQTGAVGTDELATDSVTTIKVLDGNITSGKLAANSVIAGKLADASIDTSARFAASVVDAAALGTGSVTTVKILDDNVTIAKIPAGTIVDVQLFSSSDTWTKPSKAQSVHAMCCGGGGGGGSGRRGALGSLILGGGGGGGGAVTWATFDADQLGATESVTIGASGSGGATQTVDDTNGNVGADGGSTSFGAWLFAGGGGGGRQGNASKGGGGGLQPRLLVPRRRRGTLRRRAPREGSQCRRPSPSARGTGTCCRRR